jgi:predicted nucleic-acid-binding protein
MLGLDTNILVRYIVQDDPVQSPLVSRFLKQKCTEGSPCYISHIVLCELVWVLESAYGYKRQQVSETLKLILETRQFSVEEPESALSALKIYRLGKADFSDSLLGETNQLHGCETTITLDRKASETDTFQLLTEESFT